MDEPNKLQHHLLRAARLSSETNRNLVQFCFTDLEFALSMAQVASASTEPEIRQRMLSMGRHAAALVLSRLPTLSLTADERQQMRDELQAVRERLQQNGVEL